MKMSNFRSRGRRAISPIVATVLIVAVTLVASVAIAGFVFGIFSTQSSTAQVSVTSLALTASGFQTGGSAAAATCTVAGGANQLTLSNTGTAAATATGVTIIWANTITSFAVTAPCTITAAGLTGATTAGNPQNVIFGATNQLTPSAVSGGTYTGTVTLSSGAVLLFTGTFQ